MPRKRAFWAILQVCLFSSLLTGLSINRFGLAAASPRLVQQGDENTALYLPLVLKDFQPAWIVGRVSAQGSGTPLFQVQVCSQNGECDLTDAQGNYHLIVSAGWKQLTAQKDGYAPAVQSLHVLPNQTRSADFSLIPSDNFLGAAFQGTVSDAQSNAPLAGAQVCTTPTQCATTGNDGTYTLNLNGLGQFELRAEKTGYNPLTKNVAAVNGQTVTVDFALSKQWQGAWIEGTVIDASRGREEEKALSGVSLCTQLNECAVSDAQGRYRINLSSADWREVTAQKAGFYTVAKGIQPIEGAGVTLNFVLSPYLSGLVARIVLTWDARQNFTLPDNQTIENDLDAYLYIEHSLGNRVIYWDADQDYLSSRLLYDVREGSGPETIDILKFEPSSLPTRYFYGVHHANYLYSGKQIPTLNQLGAQVCLYTTTGDIARCYTAPPGEEEFWFVFEMDQSGNLFGRDCLVDQIPQINEDQNGKRVVGVSFPSCP
ncbi:MAG: hypothetical protein DDG59_01410 [Anaerolineae bacterium]|jgi:hypothetical protein|nr:MAG: hypothetical protein DDG59_01410 [Anaerolineae bacterium]